jgi:RecA-family ATPase
LSRDSQQDIINEIKRRIGESGNTQAEIHKTPYYTRPQATPLVNGSSSGTCANLETMSAIELWGTELPPLKYTVKDVLPQGLSILCAPSKYGKSWFSLDLCLSVAAGETFLGFETEKTGVLYLALEDGYRRLKNRMGKILIGGKPPENFDFAIKSGSIDKGLSEQVDAYLKENPSTGLIVIDVLQRVRSSGQRGAGGYSLDYSDMGVLKNIADVHQLSVLVIHHLRKLADDADPFNMISGTNGIMGAADTIFLICKKTRADKEATLKMIGRDI